MSFGAFLGRGKSSSASIWADQLVDVDGDGCDEALEDLRTAVLAGDLAGVRAVLDDPKNKKKKNRNLPDIPFYWEADGQTQVALTALQLAVKYGQHAIVEEFLSRNADVSIAALRAAPDDEDPTQGRNAFTCFHLAARLASPLILDLLIANDTPPTIIYQKDGKTPLMIALEQDNIEFVRCLIQHNIDVTGLHDRSISKSTKDPEPDIPEDDEMSLVYVLRHGKPSPRLLRLLIREGKCDVNYVGHGGRSPLREFAQYSTNLSLAKVLLKEDADVDAKAEDDKTALIAALERMVQLRARINRHRLGREASHAIEKYKKQYRELGEIVSFLLDNRASLRLGKTNSKRSPLFFIVHHRLSTIIAHKRVQWDLEQIWMGSKVKLSGGWCCSRRNWTNLLAAPCFHFCLSAIAYAMFLIAFSVSRTINDEFFALSPVNDFTQEGPLIKTFPDIDDYDEMWLFLLGPMLDGLFPDDDDYIMRYNKLLTGSVMLRQLRVDPNDGCEVVSDKYEGVYPNGDCYAQWRETTKSTDQYGPGGVGWSYSGNDQEWFISGETLWAYQEDGGYEVVLTGNKTDMINTLLSLYNSGWVDIQTRALFVEFAIFNGNINLWCIVRISFELPRTGFIIPTSDFFTVRLDRYQNSGDYAILAFEIMIFMHVACYIFLAVREAIATRTAYFRDPWNYLDLGIFTLFVILIIMRITNFILFVNLDFDPDQTSYQNFSEAARVRFFENDVAGLIILLLWFKLFKYMRIFKRLGILLLITGKMITNFLVFLAVFVVVLISFSAAFFLILGSSHRLFYSWYASLITMFRATVGDAQFDVVLDQNHPLVTILFILYVVIASILLLNLLIALLNESYTDVVRTATLQYLADRGQLILSYAPDFDGNRLPLWRRIISPNLSTIPLVIADDYSELYEDDDDEADPWDDEDDDDDSVPMVPLVGAAGGAGGRKSTVGASTLMTTPSTVAGSTSTDPAAASAEALKMMERLLGKLGEVEQRLGKMERRQLREYDYIKANLKEDHVD